ncbi:MAG: site-2 protease family protein [Planctomycetota bacterium]|jgi:Zn-dependent protease
MSFLALSLSEIDMTSAILWLAAWFITIGLHEGAHAWVAYWLGDRTAFYLGKRTINPVKHIDVDDKRNLFATVVIPVITVFTLGWPLGMAWVPVNPSNFRHPTRDMALTSAAGPGGNLIGSVVGFLLLFVAVLIASGQGSNMVLHPFEFIRAGAAGTDLLAAFGLRMMVLNVLLGAINLIPVPGVDGGSVLYHFLNAKGRHTFDQLRPYGLLIFFVLAWTVFSKPINILLKFAASDVPQWIFDVTR